MKTCTKCEEPKEATLENFPPRKNSKDGLSGWCRKCTRLAHRKYASSEKFRTTQRKYRSSTKGKVTHRKTNLRESKTIKGYLRKAYYGMFTRCEQRPTYIAKGIGCKFVALDNFRDYVVNVLQVDPRGKDCHRIDNDGHYEPGNIEFLLPDEHKKVHAMMRREEPPF